LKTDTVLKWCSSAGELFQGLVLFQQRNICAHLLGSE